MKEKQFLSRRRFLGGAAAAAAGAGIGIPKRLFAGSRYEETSEPKIKEYRTLGRTGFKASDIGLGAGYVTDTALMGAILDSGINYIDSAESYGQGQVERTFGEAMKNRDRKSVFITSKMGLREEDTKEGLKERALKCLERIQSEYVDCMMIHMPSSVALMKHEGFHAAIRELKTEGKVRFCGLSQHGSQWQDLPETMEQVCLAAAEDGRFDVMLFVYNFIQTDMGEKILKVCKEKNIGATLMKTNPVGKYLAMKGMMEQMQKEGQEIPDYFSKLIPRVKATADMAESFKQKFNLTNDNEVRDAALKFVLNNPNVSSACVSVTNFDDLKAFVKLSGQKFDLKAQQTLAAYRSVFGGLYCRHACGQCESSCPQRVPVNTIMRYYHYFTAQGREKAAMTKYAGLPNKANVCADCAGHCEKACPYGVPIHGELAIAHKTLSLNV
ncbi:MAG: aldo/keto reductase [Candidatus Aminicenantes bacterium]|nr:aldo/keto reductase [Candidatus Aminicenantes bacterium]